MAPRSTRIGATVMGRTIRPPPELAAAAVTVPRIAPELAISVCPGPRQCRSTGRGSEHRGGFANAWVVFDAGNWRGAPAGMGRDDSSASGGLPASSLQRRLSGDESEGPAVATRPLCVDRNYGKFDDALPRRVDRRPTHSSASTARRRCQRHFPCELMQASNRSIAAKGVELGGLSDSARWSSLHPRAPIGSEHCDAVQAASHAPHVLGSSAHRFGSIRLR
jgi:hypothetical protein